VFVVYVRKQLKNLKRFKVMLHYLFFVPEAWKRAQIVLFL